jgi:calmodulin
MRKLGQNPTEQELQEMISSVDDNGDKEIDFEEFLILMKSRCLEQDPEKELRDAFAVFDTDGSGSIDRKELKRLMKKLGQALTEAEVDAMMDEVDSNGDGEISYEEFKYMMVRACLIVCLLCFLYSLQKIRLYYYSYYLAACFCMFRIKGIVATRSNSHSLLPPKPFSCSLPL